MSEKTRNYTDEFKRQIVNLVKSGKSSNSELAFITKYSIIRSMKAKRFRCSFYDDFL